jgi:hypothetical protein
MAVHVEVGVVINDTLKILCIFFAIKINIFHHIQRRRASRVGRTCRDLPYSNTTFSLLCGMSGSSGGMR